MFYFKTLFRNISRHGLKSLLTVFLCTLATLFLSVYMGNITANQKQLDHLPDVIPVSVTVSTLNGYEEVGLLIEGERIEQLEVSDNVRDLLYTTRLFANFAPETPEEEIGQKQILISGANDLTAFPALKEEHFTLTEGSMQDYLHRGSEGVVVADTFLKENNLKIGDHVSLALYYVESGVEFPGTIEYHKVDDMDLLIVGSFVLSEPPGSVELPTMICSIDWAKGLLHSKNLPFYAASASFYVQNPFELNDFKAEMKEIGFMSVNQQLRTTSMKGFALTVSDETFINVANSLDKNLTMMRSFLPIVLLLIVLVGYFVSFLMTQSRRSEVAVMRSVGVSRTRCTIVMLAENALLALFGCLAGVLVSMMLMNIGFVDGSIIFVAYFAGYLIGSVIAMLLLGRFSVMEVLTKAD